MAKLPGAYEYMATVGAPAINFGRGLLGYQDPFMTQTMQDRMTEIEAGRTKGNVGYDEYGLVPSAGRFTGGLMDLAINSPADFGLAGSIGKYDFGPEGRKGLNYDFTPDQDTGSTGSSMLDFINAGGLKGAFSRMGTAQASDLPGIPSNSLERDFPGMSTGDIIDSMNNRAFIGRQITPMAKPNVVDPNRIPGRIQEAVEPQQYRIRDQLARDFLQGGILKDARKSLGETFGPITNKIGSGLGSLKDFAIDKGRIGRNLLGSAGAMALGLPGIVGSGAMSLISGLGNMFEDRQISGDGTIMDEFGNSYTADELNKQNALGGYYTDAARSSRRRTSRIANMLERQRLGKKISAKNLAKLQAQEKAQEAARQAATTQMAAANRASGTGGYQAGYGSGFMDGPSGAGRGMGAADKGGSDSMGSFRDGGIASMFTRRR